MSRNRKMKHKQALRLNRMPGNCPNAKASFLGHEVFCYFFSEKKSKRILRAERLSRYAKKKAPFSRSSLVLRIKLCCDYALLTLTALSPFLPSISSNVTSSFSLTFSVSPLTCTKYSLPVDSSLMKPNPLDSLKNLTIPLFIVINISD